MWSIFNPEGAIAELQIKYDQEGSGTVQPNAIDVVTTGVGSAI